MQKHLKITYFRSIFVYFFGREGELKTNLEIVTLYRTFLQSIFIPKNARENAETNNLKLD